jgi:ubiquinone/menaquinone biosynthesis C-methylase UbiE
VKPVDYDAVAPRYDRRYESNYYDGVAAYLRQFVGTALDATIAEVGCGTGHWLTELASDGFANVVGLDLSLGMLERARVALPSARVVRGTADRLPWATASIDRVFCINALHHFRDPTAFMAECRRVLRSGGGFLTLAMDPHRRTDQWWLYDYFPAALEADLRRFASTATIEHELAAAGFRDIAVDVAQHRSSERPFSEARGRGYFDRRYTSQLMVIDDADYEAGIQRMLEEEPTLRADITFYATTAWVA